MNFQQCKLAYEMDPADLHEALEEDEPIVIVDGRSAIARAKEHVMGAAGLRHGEFTFNNSWSHDKSKLFVCCDGNWAQRVDQDSVEVSKTRIPGARTDRGFDWWKRDG